MGAGVYQPYSLRSTTLLWKAREDGGYSLTTETGFCDSFVLVDHGPVSRLSIGHIPVPVKSLLRSETLVC